MSMRSLIQGWGRRLAAISLAIVLAGPGIGVAGPGGGGHGGGGHGDGGFHGGGGGFHGGGRGRFSGHFGGGHFRGVGPRGGYFGNRRYYGFRDGYYGGYGRGWWAGGLGLGLFVPLLPWDYETLWWNDVPFYYADNSYYIWDDDVGEYQAVDPPAGLSRTPPQGLPAGPDDPTVSLQLYAYPKGGQTEQQQARDKEECQRWATSQTGFDPTRSKRDVGSDAGTQRQDFVRAQIACLEARDYTVR